MAFNLRIFFRTDPRIHKCPECGKHGALKSSRSRTIVEKVIKLLTPFRNYRCKDCGWRGYKSGYVVTLKSLQAVIFYIILLLVTAFVVSFILQRFIIK